jgi:hypothetical protein
MRKDRLGLAASALGALAVLLQMLIVPIVFGILGGGLKGIVFALVFYNFLCTLFGVHILLWNAMSMACFVTGLRLVWGPVEHSGARRVFGLFLTQIPVALITFFYILGEGHGA